VSAARVELLVRLFNEQCEFANDQSSNEESSKVQVKKKSEGATFQSPYDPDASCGHEGPGYSLHITETCNNPETTEIIADYEVHGAARSDIGKAHAALEGPLQGFLLSVFGRLKIFRTDLSKISFFLRTTVVLQF
jgi:hypothetical protein